jgi:hypothetical protein
VVDLAFGAEAAGLADLAGVLGAGFSTFVALTTGFTEGFSILAAGFLVVAGLTSIFLGSALAGFAAFGSDFFTVSTFFAGVFLAVAVESLTWVFFGVADFVIGVFSLTGGFTFGSLVTAGVLDLLKRPLMNPFLAGSWPFALSFPT